MRGWFSGRISEFHKAQTFKIKLLKRMQEALAKMANLIVVPCNYLKKSINSWGVPENKIQLIYNAPKDLLSLDIFNKDSQEEIKSDGKTILSIGRLDSWKGFHCLIEITKDLLQEIPNLKLLIIGEGDERKNLEFKIKKLGLGDKVKLVGRVSHEEIPLFFKKSDIFILNSAQEGFAHVILESMQLGVPVITTNEGGNPELIEDGVNGILVEYNNKEQLKKAIIKLINDKNLKQKFIENSKIKLKKFSWENLVNETLKALKP
jgi:glycosyltransferase involved in cell wall biosynthesis